MERIVLARLIWLLCTCACATAGSATAADPVSGRTQDYLFGFEAYFGGFKIGAGEGRLHWDDARYAMDFKARSAGMLEWVMKIDQSAESRGHRAGGPVAEHHRNHNADGDKKSWVELAFSPDGVEIVDAKPHPKTEKTRSPIPPELNKGAVDPLTAILSLGLTSAAADRCVGNVPVFDGRRRYDTVLTDAGREAYKGPAGVRQALICEFRFVRRAGYKAKAKRWKGITGTVWLQNLADGLPLLPVRVQVETSYGTALVHMVSAGPAF